MYLFDGLRNLLSKNYTFGLSFLALILLLTTNLSAAKGNLDRTFGDWGKTISFVNGAEKAHDAVVQPDGKIVVAGGAARPNDDFDFLIQRYNADGSLDQSFGNAGKAALNISQQADVAFAVTLQADGKIVAGGYISQVSGFSDYCLVRLLPDGSLDQSFGDGGVKIFSVAADSDIIVSLAMQNHNGAEKIIVGGYVGTGLPQFCVARLNTDGQLDATFGDAGTGIKRVSLGGLADVLQDIVIDSHSRIVAAGYNRFNGGGGNFRDDFAVVRFTPDGQLDTTFSGDGKLATQMGQFSQARSIIVQNVGGEDRYVVGGFARVGNANDFALARYKNNGDLDTTFGASGRTFTDFAGDEEQIHELLLSGNGKIYGVGFMRAGSNQNFAAARYHPNGILDKDFASCGKLTSDFRTSTDIAYGAAIQTDGKIIAVGETANGSTSADFTVARYTTGGQATATNADFDGDGKEDVSVYRPSEGVWYANCACQGFRAVRFGLATDIPVAADYDGDGRTDQAVYRGGTWFIYRSSDNHAAIVNFGLADDIPTVGDYDGDDRADISVWRASTGVWYVLRSSDLEYTATGFGQTGDKPVPADYDADGKTDLAVYRGGDWWIQQSSDSPGNLVFRQFGIETDIALANDFDGDGRADLNVYRAAEGNWYQQFTASTRITRFGTSTDKPVSADFDGDSRADIAVFRNGQWHVLSSSTNSYSVTKFGLDGDIPTVVR